MIGICYALPAHHVQMPYVMGTLLTFRMKDVLMERLFVGNLPYIIIITITSNRCAID
jgi:hypothetical protein